VAVLLTQHLAFPDPGSAESRGPHQGLVAVGGDLSVERLRLAYRSGVFPWSDRPVTWWSPDPRAIFDLDRVHISESLARTIRRRVFAVTVNRAFREVMAGCAASGPGRVGTWITRQFIEAYTRLHEQGEAHSVECWHGNELVGGVYGVAAGGLFAGESMFHRASNASKVALVHLIERLRHRGFRLFDIQMLTPVTRQMGATEIPRAEYLRRLADAVACPVTFR
jgi:leucyl/phenylalanyl-tRNA--protein transferase